MNVLLVFLAVAVMIGSWLWIRREKKKAAIRIQSLKRSTDIRIREARAQSAREAYGKIGQNLHDELSSSLAGIVHQMEILTRQTEDEHIKRHINILKIETGKVYESVRDKSHLLYSNTSDHDPDHFDEYIKSITGFILPDSLYRKEIDIDKKTAGTLNQDQRTEILRILKEAATNIRKHAKNATEVFVFLYEDENREVIFQVGDNGETFKRTRDGIGLKSIRERVLGLKGKFNIETGGGTVLTVTLPVKPLPELELTS